MEINHSFSESGAFYWNTKSGGSIDLTNPMTCCGGPMAKSMCVLDFPMRRGRSLRTPGLVMGSFVGREPDS